MATISTKTVARIASVQALYQFEINNRTVSIAKLTQSIVDNYSSNDFNTNFEIPTNVTVKLHKKYLEELVTYSITNLSKIDGIINIHLAKGWTRESMHIALLSLLRVAIAEILYFPEVPYKVVINEFTTIASDLVKSSEISFVNSLLDTVRAEYRPQDGK
jgi:N utilization substance protein B